MAYLTSHIEPWKPVHSALFSESILIKEGRTYEEWCDYVTDLARRWNRRHAYNISLELGMRVILKWAGQITNRAQIYSDQMCIWMARIALTRVSTFWRELCDESIIHQELGGLTLQLDGTNHMFFAWRMKFPCRGYPHVIFAQQFMILMVIYSDDYVRPKPLPRALTAKGRENITRRQRYFAIAGRLPFELQTILARRTAGLGGSQTLFTDDRDFRDCCMMALY